MDWLEVREKTSPNGRPYLTSGDGTPRVEWDSALVLARSVLGEEP